MNIAMPLSTESTLTIGLAITLMGAAASFATMWSKIGNAERKHDEDEQRRKDRDKEVSQRLDRLEDKLDKVLEILAGEGLKKTD